MTRKEHLDWCKARALEYVNAGNNTDAFTSMLSDMANHEETADHMALEMGTMLLLSGNLKTPSQMRDWITGFN